MAEYKDLPGYERLPDHHMLSPETRSIVEATVNIALRARGDILDAAAQLHVADATWGLGQWEDLVGITPEPGQSDAARRSAIIVKMMGSGTCNASMISAIAKSVSGYEAIVVERFSEYTFSLSFVGDSLGLIDVDRAAIINMVEQVKPAHLRFIFDPVTWWYVDSAYKTWGEVEALDRTWGEIANMVIVVTRESVEAARKQLN